MTTEQRVTDIETWLNKNKDAVSLINGLVSSVDGRLTQLAQGLTQVEQITDATLTSNVKDLVD